MNSLNLSRLFIEEWEPAHPRWAALLQVVEGQGQGDWVAFSADFHRSSYMLVARHGEEIMGFLRFVVQEIGLDAGCPPVVYNGVPLTEAKVLAFGVLPERQRQGVGRALQVALIRAARHQGCYQVRSHSSGDHAANHQLKLSLGFGVHPIIRGDDTRGAYFVLPLAAGDIEEI